MGTKEPKRLMDMITFIIFFVAVVATLYWRAESLDIRFNKSVDEYEDVEDPHAELFWGSGKYRLSPDQNRIIDAGSGKGFIATRDEIAEIKKISRLTCAHCDTLSCEFRGDAYNTNGDCLASK
jgi:hypothetical protein